MKKFFFLGLIFCLSLGACRQEQKLEDRLEAMLKVTREKNFEKILDYTYPKVFKYASREQVKEALRSGFETDEFSTTLDSVKIRKIFPVFSIQDAQYAKIIHTMRMNMKFKEPIDSARGGNYVQMMEMQFGEGTASMDLNANTLHISISPELIAIKDKYSKEWTFVNYEENDKLTGLLFSKEVIAKLNEYK